MKIAITGGTGFVGSHLVDSAIAAGHEVVALTRREQPPREAVTWISGDLHDRAALERLVDDAVAVIHVAGVISAQSAAAFEKGNVEGTLSMLAAATAGGLRRFVHVSSLAAREPNLSLYGASKAAAEGLVHGSGLDWSIVRPPAVYGPGDKETFELFRMAKLGVMLMPPKGRVSVIHAHDLCRLLLALAAPKAPSTILIEPDDGKAGGWTHREFARALGEYGSVVFISGNMPGKTEIAPLLIMTRLERYDYAGATAIAVVMLLVSFSLLLVVNRLQAWTGRRAPLPTRSRLGVS